MRPSRAPNGTSHRKGEMAAWLFSRLWSVSDPTLFQMMLVSALLATVLGKCGPPPNSQFASPTYELTQREFKTGTILRYTCRPGYSRISSSQVISCKNNGQWEFGISCVKKRCSHPGDLPNGQVKIKTDLSFGSQIEFSCSEGYILIGSTNSHCEIQEKGVAWSDPLPVCVIIQCAPPPEISNGRHSGEYENDYMYGSSVTYTCDYNFLLIGNASISCTVENKTVGAWSPSPPTCKKVTCPQPIVPHGDIVSGFRTTYHYKDSVMFDCPEGFFLRGTSIIFCEADDNWNPFWNPSPPTCELSACIGLPNISHASWDLFPWQINKNVFRNGAVLKYRCDDGYKPATTEATTVTCQKDFKWSPFKGCKEVCCPTPELKNGRIISPKKHPITECTYSYGDVFKYVCNENQVHSAICQSDGTWSPKKVSCDTSCDFPPTIDHGHHTQANTYNIFKNEVIYKCNEGYKMIGQPRLSCTSSQWSPAAPQCKALCLKPEIENGKLSVNKTHYVETENVTIHCDSGFEIVGPKSIMCSENRTWYPELPKCEWEIPEDCGKVSAGRKLMQCLPSPEEVKMALELYKLSVEIEILELQRNKARISIQASYP